MFTDEVLAYLFDGQPHLLEPHFAAWMGASRRFVSFADTFRDKIRKKLRATHEPESLLDLQLELETAYLLLRERALSVVYEPQPPGQARSPDFAVSFTTSLTFMVEATRLRAEQAGAAALAGPGVALLPGERLADTVCGKLSQLLAQRSNVLVIGVEGPQPTQADLRAAMLRQQQRAERNDPAFLRRHRFRDRAGFFQQLQRLSEVIVRDPQEPAAWAAFAWVNPLAKHALPAKVRTALYRSQGL